MNTDLWTLVFSIVHANLQRLLLMLGQRQYYLYVNQT